MGTQKIIKKELENTEELRSTENFQLLKMIQKDLNKIELEIFGLIDEEHEKRFLDKYYETIQEIHNNQLYIDKIYRKVKKNVKTKHNIYDRRVQSLKIETLRIFMVVSTICGTVYSTSFSDNCDCKVSTPELHIPCAQCAEDDGEDEE